ncbi:MAG: glucose-6-phosphate dehydrogenase assembly protein OpcA [Chlamydiales bacterium]|nr:glucose-6-phosphate dehydrogenase assembly protein OpcA [Chlamydiales bacterium]
MTNTQENIDIAGQNLIKASLFNLIVVANTPQRGQQCKELVRLVTEKFPCRVIFVQSDDSTQADYFHTEHTIQSIGTGDTRVCFDQFTIESSTNQLHKVPFLILPNIMPDLPVYILMGQDPTLDHVILPQLKNYANRVVFDCESIDNLQRFSERMLAMMSESTGDLIDVNWARTKAWREVMARVFNTEETLEHLAQAKMIQITFSGKVMQHQAAHEIQAVYLQAWLAAQLGWNLDKIEKDGTVKISYHSQTAPVSITIIPKDNEILEPGAIFSIEVMTNQDAHYLISHERESNLVTVHASTLERCEMPYTIFLNNYQKGTSLVNEIFYQPLSEHYEAMLHSLNTPAWGTSLS